MATTEWLAEGTEASTSAPLTLAAGEQATISIFRTSGESLNIGCGMALVKKVASNTENCPTNVALDGSNPVIVIQAEGSYVVERINATQAFGVDHDGGTVGDA